MKSTIAAQIVSFLLHPWLVLATGALLLVDSNLNTIGLWLLFVVVGMGPGVVMEIVYYFREDQKVSALDRYVPYVLGFALLAVVYGSQLIAEIKWMYLAMAIAVFYGLIIIVQRYFQTVSVHAAVLIFWCTVLMDKVSIAYFAGFLLLLPLFYAHQRLRKRTATAILWGLTIGLVAGLFTWL